MKPMTPQEQDQLIDALIDGSITDADHLRIEAELIVDPRARQAYYRRIQLDLLLEQEAGLQPAAQAHELPTTSPAASWTSGRRVLFACLFIGMAASLFLALVPYLPLNEADESSIAALVPQHGIEPSANGFAVLRSQADATWSGRQLADGDLLPTGDLQLRAGSVHIELFSGVQMVIEGTAKFSIDSPMQVTLHEGRARARVPEPAQGFVVKTGSGDIVDLGTEFALAVSAGEANVRVLDGEVELVGLDSSRRRITDGEAVRLGKVDASPSVSELDVDVISPLDFQTQTQASRNKRLAIWQSELLRLRSDPRLIAFYQLSESSSDHRTVANLSMRSTEAASDGAIVAAKIVADRWGRNGNALDFSPIGSRVRVDVPGSHRGLTLNCWVKINSIDRWYNSLFLTDGHDDREPHWQIMNDGRVFFSVKVPPAAGSDKPAKQPEYYSPSIWNASLSGRWIMLSVTYDVDAKTVTHYLNGSPLSSESISDSALVESIRVGAASICNWNEPMYRNDAKFVVRNLNGSMDELSIYSGALTEQEIMGLYRIGNGEVNDVANER